MKQVLVALAVCALLSGPAMAAFQLDSRYQDKDGDMVADIPADKSQQVDPPVLIFAYTPVEDPAVYADVWQGFLDYLSKVTGKPVQFFPVQSSAAQIEAMRAGRLHIAGFNTGSNPLAVACAGFHPFAMMAHADGSSGFSSTPPSVDSPGRKSRSSSSSFSQRSPYPKGFRPRSGPRSSDPACLLKKPKAHAS